MMSKSIELLIKFHNPKCVSVEANNRRGSTPIRKEQVIFAFVQAEKAYMFGYHLLMYKYRQDVQSYQFIHEYIRTWCEDMALPEHSEEALSYVVNMVCELPVPSQLSHLNALRKRYLRSQYAHLSIINKANKIAEDNGLSPNSPEARQLRIRELSAVRKSNVCPRCRGTGQVGRVHKRECPECRGKGRLRATIYHLMKSLDCTEAYFKRYLLAAIVDFEQHCYGEMNRAEVVIQEKLKEEC